MTTKTIRFKKRFHLLSIKEKMNCVEVVGYAVATNKMPGGRPTTADEHNALTELLEWCNLNMFFDLTPGFNS